MGDLFAPSHVILILIFALLFFGPKKLPELGHAFGKTLREFREGAKDVETEKKASHEQIDAPVEVRDVRRLD